MEEAGLRFRVPEGAYYVMADFRGTRWDARKYAQPRWTLDRIFAETIARDVGVAVVPGSSFYYGSGGESTVRFNFAKREETLREAAARMKKLRPAADPP